MKLLGLSGSPAKKSSSRTLSAVDKALSFAKAYDETVHARSINIRDLDVQFCDGRDPALYGGDTKEVIDQITDADAIILGTPIYRGSYTGILKNVFDIIPNNVLVGKPVGIVVTGSTQHHYLAIEHGIKPLLGFFHAHALPGGVYAHSNHYAENVLVNEDILERLDQLAKALVDFTKLIPADRNILVGASGPVIPWESLLKGSHSP